jgi:ADP-heptose:LPS heptosyltransferase
MDVRKICVVHLNQIGDLLFSLPLYKALKERYPGAAIDSVIRPSLEEIIVHSRDIRRVLYRRGGFRNMVGLMAEMRRQRYDLLITLSRSETCLVLAALSGATFKAGFRHFPWDMGLDVKEDIEGPSSWHNHRRLLRRLNIEPTKQDYVGLLTLPDNTGSERPSKEYLSKLGEKYVVVSPGTSARRGIKAWGIKPFGELIVLLKERYGLNPVLVGDGKDWEANDRIVQKVREIAKEGDPRNGLDTVLNLAGKTSLGDVCFLLKRAALFVGVDSGIMHLASALDIPVVGIFGPTDPRFVGPQNARSVVVQKTDLDCVPCDLKGCKERPCLETLDVGEVFDACRQLLDRRG